MSIGGKQIAVFEADAPTGPWRDPLGDFLLANGSSLSPPTNIRDPGVLRDDDGRHYIVFGACDGANQPDDACYYAAELHDDMISYEPPRHLSVKGVLGHFGYGKADDKPFLHKRGDLYYLSWGCFYATASEVFGPYQYKGCIIEEDLVEEAFMVGNQTAERSQRWRSPASRGDVDRETRASAGSRTICHVVLSLLVGDAAPPRRKDAAYGATDAAAPLLADGAPAGTGGDAEAPAPAGDAPAWSAEPAGDKTRGPAESREAAAPRRDARTASLAEEQLACCAAEAEEWSVGLVCVCFLALFVALRVALGSDRGPPVLTLTEELEATLTVADLHGKRYDLPAWVEQVGVSLRRSYERPLSVAGLLRDVDEPASGVAPPRRAGGLRRRAALFAVTLPLCRVLAVFGAFLVPGRVLRYAAVAVVDALGVFAAADALVCAVFVAAVDLPNLFTHLAARMRAGTGARRRRRRRGATRWSSPRRRRRGTAAARPRRTSAAAGSPRRSR